MRQPVLLEIVQHCIRRPDSRAGIDRRQQQTDEHAENRDDDQELDERKTRSMAQSE